MGVDFYHNKQLYFSDFTFGDGDVAAHVSVPQHSPEGYILQATSLQLREALQGDGLEANAAP